MNHVAILLLRALVPGLGVLLGLLGFATRGANLLGWFLFVAGVAYSSGAVITAYILRRNFWDSQLTGLVPPLQSSHGSYWLLAAGLAGVCYLSPLEFLYLKANDTPAHWLELLGACLVVLGGGLFLWALCFRSKHLKDDPSVTKGQARQHIGPYRWIRYPGYAAYLLAALGLTVGYSSLWGLVALLLLLVPGVLWRVRLEEQQLLVCFGKHYLGYASRTRRLIPGLW